MVEFYLINLSTEVRRGMTEKASRSEPTCAPPFGYIIKDKNTLPITKTEKLKIEAYTLKTELAAKDTQIKLLELELKHKEEMLKVHDFYNKILSRE